MMDEQFLKKLHETFTMEAQEHIQTMFTILGSKVDDTFQIDTESIDSLFRSMHSLKGAARTVGETQIETICQAAESILRKIRGEELVLNSDIISHITITLKTVEMLLKEADHVENKIIENLLNQAKLLIENQRRTNDSKNEPTKMSESKRKLTVRPKVSATEHEKTSPKTESPLPQDVSSIPEPGQSSDYLKIKTNKLDQLLNLGNEITFLKLQLQKHIHEVNHLITEHHKQYDPSQIDENQNRLKEMGKKLENDVMNLEKFSDFLNLEMRNLVMVPFSYISDSLYRFVSEYSATTNKKIKLTISGGEIEIDKVILDKLRTPLIHLVRNAVDHGIEPNQLRKEMGKPLVGHVEIYAELISSTHLKLVVKDDGAGISIKRIKKKAVSTGLIKSEEFDKLTQAEQLNFIFRPGFSSVDIVTEISGQGLGMSIVQQITEELGGSIKVRTSPGEGTEFLIICPVRSINLRGVFVSIQDEEYAIPIQYVEGVMSFDLTQTFEINGQSAVLFKDEPLGLLSPQILGIGDYRIENTHQNAIVLKVGNRKSALLVDSVLYEKEMILKKPGLFVSHFSHFSALTLTEDYQLVPVIDVVNLVKDSSTKYGLTIAQETNGESVEQSPKKVLIAEDSVTSRNFIKNILEIAGFQVKAVVDGQQAFLALQEDSFDAVITDIEMPNMDGFELTQKIRQYERTKDLPVILVTSLSSDEDKAKGIEVGANAYIVKSQFNQTTLIDILRRFI